MNTTMTPKLPREAMYKLSLAKPVPDAELLDEIVKQYPQHAEVLTEFAIELAIDAMLHDVDDPDVPENPDVVSPIVSRAMSRFQNQLFSVREGQVADPSPQAATSPIQNPFESLGRERFRSLAADIYGNTVLLSKLRDRQIDPETIPEGFRKDLAKQMDIPIEILASHFQAPSDALPTRQFFKSDGKPTQRVQQSFEDAVRQSGLTSDQQRRLLAYGD